jgi:hypothetical protein
MLSQVIQDLFDKRLNLYKIKVRAYFYNKAKTQISLFNLNYKSMC